MLGLCIDILASVIYPTLSELSTENNKENFVESVETNVNCVSLLVYQ